MSRCNLEVERIQMNTAKAAADQATKKYNERRDAYLTCLPTEKRSETLVADVEPTISSMNTDAKSIEYMNGFLLRFLEREEASFGAQKSLKELASVERDKLAAEIERLKSDISTEKRRFLDSGAQVSPAVGGFYFTRVPDNQVLIAFIACLGAFLLLAGVAVYFNSFGIQYIANMKTGERGKVILSGWLFALIVSYIGFSVFT